MLNIIIESDKGEILINQTLQRGSLIAIFLIVAAFYLTFYVLRSIGVYKLAKSQGVKNAFLAWIPCVWIFTACKTIGKSRFFGFTMEKAAVWVCVVFSFATILPLVHQCFSLVPYGIKLLQGEEFELIFTSSGNYINPKLVYSDGLTIFLNILYIFNRILRLAEIFVMINVYIALFRKFWPEHYILAAVLSFFGLFPIMVFAIRNRKAVDFNEYIRNRYYGAGYTPYGNRYYGQNGQNNDERGTPYYGNSSDNKDEPFDEFSNRPEEPFSEFDDNKKNDDK